MYSVSKRRIVICCRAEESAVDKRYLAVHLLSETADLFGRRGFSASEKGVAEGKLLHTVRKAAAALCPGNPTVKRYDRELEKQYQKYLDHGRARRRRKRSSRSTK